MWHCNPRSPVARTKRGALAALWLATMFPLFAAAQSNPVVVENQQPGSDAWNIEWGFAGNDIQNQVKGYASATSVNKGGSINLHVSVNPAQTYTLDVFRMGYYQGHGGRLMQHVGPLSGTKQANCATQPTTGLIECGWTASYTLNIPTTWTSGLYMVVLTNAANLKNYVSFVVRDDSRAAALLYQQPVTTYQAYNDYPYNESTGKSLYSFNSYGANTAGGMSAAVKVSFDRPYNGDGDANVWGANVLGVETAFIRWMEKSGYDVTYATDIDTHLNPGMLLNYKGIILGGHDEYWTKEMFEGFGAARDAGVNLGFFSANISYTQIRIESSTAGVPNRVLTCYREAPLDSFPDITRKTVNWRDSPVNRPEQTLIGTMYTSVVQANGQGIYAPYKVTNANHWAYAGTGFVNGNTVTGLVGYEADRIFNEHPLPTSVAGTFTILATSPFAGSNGSETQNSTIYQAPSGAWVFGAGTINWGFALDSYNPSGGSLADTRIQKMTANIFDKFIEGSQSGFTLSSSPSSQGVIAGSATSFTLGITPLAGFSGSVTFSVTGLPSGASAQFTPNPASSSASMQVTTSASTPGGTSTLTITGVSGAITRTVTASLAVTTPDFSLSATPGTRSIAAGLSTTYSIAINPVSGFSSNVALSVSGLPAGATADITPNPAGTSATLTVNTAASTPGGTSALSITGVSGALTRTASASLTVTTPDFSLGASPGTRSIAPGQSTTYAIAINPVSGFSSSVALSVSGLPAGASADFTPNPAGTSATLTVTTDASTTGGTNVLTITGVAGLLTRTTTASLQITAPSFTLGATPASQSVAQGASANYSLTITPSGGFASDVALSISGLPAGTSAQFTPNPATGTSSLVVSTTAATPAGTVALTITGVSGALTRTANVNMTVTVPDFALAATPALRTLTPGASTTYAIAVTPSGGFAGNVALSVSGLPAGTTAAFSPNPAGSSSTLTVTTSASTPGGTSSLTISGVSGSLTRTATVSLTVTAQDYSFILEPGTRTVVRGDGATYAITLTKINGFTGAVTYSIAGLPADTTYEISPNPATGDGGLFVLAGGNAPGGTSVLTITGTSNGITHTATTLFNVNAPVDFSAALSPTSRTVTQGQAAAYSLTVTPVGGFTGSVTFSVTGLPSGAAAAFTPNPTTGTSALSITTAANTPAGSYPLSFTAVSGALSHIVSGTLVVSAPTPNTITVSAPNTAVSWRASTVQNITYTHNLGAGQPVNIELSRDGGSSWSAVASSTTTTGTTGTYAWAVTGPPTTLGRIRVSSAGTPAVNDISNVNFTITNPTVTMSTPNTAVSWQAGSAQSVKVNHTLGSGQNINLETSRDGGTSWAPLTTVATTTATSVTYSWTVTGPTTTTGRIRATWAGDAAVTDISDVNFSITSRTKVTAPNTAVTWAAGTTRPVTWSHNLGVGGLVDIDFSADNGATWSRIASNVASSAATTGTANVDMPDVISTQARIRVSPASTPDMSLGDISDVSFTLQAATLTVTTPNTNVAWAVGTTQGIKWNHNLGTLEPVKIEIARDGVNFNEVIQPSFLNSGATSSTYNWVVTGPVSTTAKIRVTSLHLPALNDASNVNFRVQ